MLPDALKTRCSRCSKLQKEKSLDVITRLYYQHPKLYTALAERYDPTGEYTRNFERWFDEQNAVKPRPAFRQSQSREGDQQEVRRSPSSSGLQNNFNNLQTERTRIPSTWITSTTVEPTTARRITSTRATLRTTVPPFRTTTQREETPQIFREVVPILRSSPTVTGTFPTFREQSRPSQITSTLRTSGVRFETPAIIREFPVASLVPEPTFSQSNSFEEPSLVLKAPQEPALQPEQRTQESSFFRESTLRADPQFTTASQRWSPPEKSEQPTVIFRDATTATIQTEPSSFRSSIIREKPTASVTNPPRVRTTSYIPINDPQVYSRSQERNSNPDIENESSKTFTRPSVPVRNSPSRPQTSFQDNQRTQIYRNPTPVAPLAQAPPIQEPQFVPSEQNNERIFGKQDRRSERVSIHQLRFIQNYIKLSIISSSKIQPDNEPDLIDRFFIPDGNLRFRKSVEQLMDSTGKVVGNVAEMLRSGLQAITTKTKLSSA